jgi:hypothetical protein
MFFVFKYNGHYLTVNKPFEDKNKQIRKITLFYLISKKSDSIKKKNWNKYDFGN